MKKIVIAFLLFLSKCSYAQSVIACYPFSVTTNKTSNILFPYPIRSVDHGSAALWVQRAKGTENVLQLKAAKENMDTTTLTVVTSDGKLYPFLVSYESRPEILNISFVAGAGKPLVQFADETEDAAALDKDAAAVMKMPAFLSIRIRAMMMQLRLHGIYLKNNLLWFVFSLSNHAQVPFSPSYIQFFIRDQSRARRTAFQEQRLDPVYLQPVDKVDGDGEKRFACAFSVFTIAKHKRWVLQINEQKGGRMLQLMLKPGVFLKAQKID